MLATPSCWASSKKALFRAYSKPPVELVVDDSYLRQYNETLGKISSSLNQIAKRINSTGNVYEEDMKKVKGIMDEVWRTQKAMLKKQPLIYIIKNSKIIRKEIEGI